MNDNEKAIVLTSPEPFEDIYMSYGTFLKKALIASIPAIILALILHSALGDIGAFIGMTPFFIVMLKYVWSKNKTAQKMKQMPYMKFKFINVDNLNDVCRKIENMKDLNGNRMDVVRDGDFIAVTYDKVQYHIFFNDDDTFSISWQKSGVEKVIFSSAVGKILDILAEFSGNDGVRDTEPIWKYNKLRVGMPLIAYRLQETYGIKA